jgi:hypothetical protein
MGHCLVLLAESADEIVGLATDGTALYWFSGATSTEGISHTNLMSVPVVGGNPTTLASPTAEGGVPERGHILQVDSSTIYWAAYSGEGHGIYRMPKSGGAPTLLAATSDVDSIVLDQTSVYWSDQSGAVMSVPKGGGATSHLFDGSYCNIAVDETSLYWSQYGRMWSMPKAGGTPTSLTTMLDTCYTLTTDDSNIYWVGTPVSSFQVTSVPKAGGEISVLAINQGFSPGIVADGTSVYWGDDDHDAIVGVGGTIIAVPNHEVPVLLALDSGNVYFSVGSPHRLYKLIP